MLETEHQERGSEATKGRERLDRNGKVYRPGKEQDYTESVQECSQLAKSFGNGDFVDRVCIAVLEELERCWKGREEE